MLCVFFWLGSPVLVNSFSQVGENVLEEVQLFAWLD